MSAKGANKIPFALFLLIGLRPERMKGWKEVSAMRLA